MTNFENAINSYLAKAQPVNRENLDNCLEGIEKAILSAFHTEPESEFRLRMSNIGRDLRQLMLEKKYGREKITPQFLLKMLTGSIQEHVLIYILRSAGLDIKTDGEVTLAIADREIKGTWDLVYGKMYDVKTASEYSFKYKFNDYNSLASGDSFGYIDQLIGYSLAEGVEPGGWLVMNKSSGEIKTVHFPYTLAEVSRDFHKRMETKIAVLDSGEMPECTGVEPEAFNKRLTGDMIIGKRCMFCPHKQKCHPTASFEPSRQSRAKEPPMTWYLG